MARMAGHLISSGHRHWVANRAQWPVLGLEHSANAAALSRAHRRWYRGHGLVCAAPYYQRTAGGRVAFVHQRAARP